MNAATPAVVSAALGPAAGQMLTIVNPIDTFLSMVNTNPFFIGIMMLMLNLGGRFLGLEISKNQEKVMSHPWVRRFFIFTVLFVATRNVLVAFFLTIVVLLLLAFLLNENSDLYLGGKTPADPATGQMPGLTPEETEILRRLSEKQQRMAKSVQPAEEEKGTGAETPIEDIYLENLVALQGAH